MTKKRIARNATVKTEIAGLFLGKLFTGHLYFLLSPSPKNIFPNKMQIANQLILPYPLNLFSGSTFPICYSLYSKGKT